MTAFRLPLAQFYEIVDSGLNGASAGIERIVAKAINTVRYEAVNAMLLNEFLKEHRKVEQQQAAIAELKSLLVILLGTLLARQAHGKTI
jgi:hypothetical protein